MADVEEIKANKATSYLVNLALLLLIGYLAFTLLYQPKSKEVTPPKKTEIAVLNDYGAPAYIGNDLKKLLPYDVKIPFEEGVFIVVVKGGRMIFTMHPQVEISLNDECSIQLNKNSVNVLSGQISVDHPSGKIPETFQIYLQDKLVSITDLPAVIQ